MGIDGLTASASWQKVVVLILVWVGFAWIVRPIGQRWLLMGLRKAQERSHRSKAEKEQRSRTIVRVLSATVMMGLTGALVLVGMAAMGFDIGPLIAGAGVLGLAIGFGAQNLVKDIINGLFILVEDQFGAGDVVTIKGITGEIEEFNLRRTVLRDEQGVAHHIPNSQVNMVANLTQDWAYVLLVIKVGIEEEIDKVVEVLQQSVKKVEKKGMLGEVEVRGPEEMAGGVMTFEVRVKVEKVGMGLK